MRALDVDNMTWLMTERVAHWELSSIRSEIDEFKATGRLSIKSVPARGSPASQKYWRFVKDGYDKGEAEAVAWASELPVSDRPLFISNDVRARELARRNRVPVGDVMDLTVAAIQSGALAKERATEILEVWQDKRQSLCRPVDYTTFEETFTTRTR